MPTDDLGDDGRLGLGKHSLRIEAIGNGEGKGIDLGRYLDVIDLEEREHTIDTRDIDPIDDVPAPDRVGLASEPPTTGEIINQDLVLMTIDSDDVKAPEGSRIALTFLFNRAPAEARLVNDASGAKVGDASSSPLDAASVAIAGNAVEFAFADLRQSVQFRLAARPCQTTRQRVFVRRETSGLVHCPSRIHLLPESLRPGSRCRPEWNLW